MGKTLKGSDPIYHQIHQGPLLSFHKWITLPLYLNSWMKSILSICPPSTMYSASCPNVYPALIHIILRPSFIQFPKRVLGPLLNDSFMWQTFTKGLKDAIKSYTPSLIIPHFLNYFSHGSGVITLLFTLMCSPDLSFRLFLNLNTIQSLCDRQCISGDQTNWKD